MSGLNQKTLIKFDWNKITHFKMIGAGDVHLENYNLCSCGGEIGLGFAMSYEKYNAGGVMPISEVRKLESALHEWLKKYATKKAIQLKQFQWKKEGFVK